jgi:hypothetical protein
MTSNISQDCVLTLSDTNKLSYFTRDRHDRDHMVVELYLTVQSVPITTKVVSSNLIHGEVYSIQHFVIKLVSDLRQVGGFLWVLLFPPPIKITVTI